MNDKVLSGLDASRRVGWARAYAAGDLAQQATTGVVLLRMLLIGGAPTEEVLAVARNIEAHLTSTDMGAAAVRRAHDHLRTWAEREP